MFPPLLDALRVARTGPDRAGPGRPPARRARAGVRGAVGRGGHRAPAGRRGGPAVPRPAGPWMHYQTRPRGGSKTTDAAGVAGGTRDPGAPALHLAHLRTRSRAGGAAGGRYGCPGRRTRLGAVVDVAAGAVTVRASRARLVVESADAASAYGHLPWLVIADEVAQWPTTREARALWEALVSGLPKWADSRLAVLTTAGDPVHCSAAGLVVPAPARAGGSRRWPGRCRG
jgi:hypothetical protein